MEIFGMLFGAILRLAPELMKLFTQKRDQDHELRMTRLQLDIDLARSQQQIDLVHANAAAAQGTAEMQGWIDAIVGQGKPTGVPWIDALSSSVRPILTYWWCIVLYTGQKAILLYLMLTSDATLASIADQVVTEFDRATIGSILSFWFLDRSLRRTR